MNFQGELLSWYNTHKRDLPWRSTRDPYLVWLSEVMLQQTRVSQGLGYYNRFIETFPTLHSLAAASEQQVLRLWQGLGYYSRARNMHHTARELLNIHGGHFPATAKELEKLRGIGHYTAAAIASICFGEATAVLDGNVARVLARLTAFNQPVDSPAGIKTLRTFANQLIDPDNPADYNQAMMELGALVCTPGNPSCAECPVSSHCLAFQQRNVASFPIKMGKKPPLKISFFYLVICYQVSDTDYIVLRKRSGEGIWKNMYDFPAIESRVELSEEEIFGHFSQLLQTTGTTFVFGNMSPAYTHQLTHRTITAKFLTAICSSKPVLSSDLEAVPVNALSQYPLPRLIEHYLQR